MLAPGLVTPKPLVWSHCWEYIIEINNDERGAIADFTMISDIRITKAEPE